MSDKKNLGNHLELLILATWGVNLIIHGYFDIIGSSELRGGGGGCGNIHSNGDK